MSTIRVDSSLIDVLGKRSADKMEKELDLRTVGDLISHYPRKYLSIGSISTQEELIEGAHVCFASEVVSSKWLPSERRRGRGPQGRCVVNIKLQSGTIEAVFWNQPWMEGILPAGRKGLFSGVVGSFRGKKQLTSPLAEPYAVGSIRADDAKGAHDVSFIDTSAWIDRLMPIYPATAKLSSSAIQRSVALTLDALIPVDDPIGQADRARLGLIDLDSALRSKHHPRDKAEVKVADERLKFQEALTMQLALSVARRDEADRPAVPRPLTDPEALNDFDDNLAFRRTPGQVAVGEVIGDELSQTHPMHRLLQGDVGSGKTLVALRAMLQTAATGGQSALLAPTEVLAHQHLRSIRNLLGPLGGKGELGSAEHAVKVVTLTAGMPAAARREATLDVASGAADIVIGTHALLEPTVSFADLGLVVIDEQHRFGVEQRDALRQKGREGTAPHTLVMTATPIPRTIAITAFGHLEPLMMTDMPPGRSPIKTTAISAPHQPDWVARAWDRVREEVAAGHQAYVVCPRIEPEEDAAATGNDDSQDEPELTGPRDYREPLTAVMDKAEELRSGPLHGLRIETLHGKMTSEDKDGVMNRFAAGKIDVLVATTVIEVGVDVPNATAMIIVDADRFGLATLHQLRGRVGRGSAPGVCLLITNMHPKATPFERLRVLERTTDGFAIAERDLEFRREGDILGVAQSGTRTQLRLLSLRDDLEVIQSARAYCDEVVASDPDLTGHPVLRIALETLRRGRAVEYLHKN